MRNSAAPLRLCCRDFSLVLVVHSTSQDSTACDSPRLTIPLASTTTSDSLLSLFGAHLFSPVSSYSLDNITLCFTGTPESIRDAFSCLPRNHALLASSQRRKDDWGALQWGCTSAAAHLPSTGGGQYRHMFRKGNSSCLNSILSQRYDTSLTLFFPIY